MYNKSTTFFKKINLISLGVVCIASIPAFLWTYFADQIKSKSNLTLWLTSKRLFYWNFGSLQGRLKAFNLEAVFGRIWLLGGLLALVTIILALRGKRNLIQVISLFAISLSPIFVYFNLYVVHDYYYMAIFPIFILAIAFAFRSGKTESIPWNKLAIFSFLIIPTVVLLWVVQFQQRDYLKILHQDRSFLPQRVLDIKKFTSPEDEILEVGCDWDPSDLYNANRYGIATPSWTGNVNSTMHFLQAENRIKDLNYLVVCNNLLVNHQIAGYSFDQITPNLYRIRSRASS
jgi:hypothetical protein